LGYWGCREIRIREHENLEEVGCFFLTMVVPAEFPFKAIPGGKEIAHL
jgi:hypothetical protein